MPVWEAPTNDGLLDSKEEEEDTGGIMCDRWEGEMRNRAEIISEHPTALQKVSPGGGQVVPWDIPT